MRSSGFCKILRLRASRRAAASLLSSILTTRPLVFEYLQREKSRVHPPWRKAIFTLFHTRHVQYNVCHTKIILLFKDEFGNKMFIKCSFRHFAVLKVDFFFQNTINSSEKTEANNIFSISRLCPYAQNVYNFFPADLHES